MVDLAVPGTGLLKTIARDHLWDRIREPRLEIGSAVVKSSRESPAEERDSDLTTTVFRVPVHNTGTSAARNCRVRLEMIGQAKPPTSGDDSSVSENAERLSFEIETGLCWSEPGKPSTITISRDGTGHFDLVMIQKVQGSDEDSADIVEAVKFPTEGGWGGASPIEITGAASEDGSPTAEAGNHGISGDQLMNADYSKSELTVTADNAESASAAVGFSHEMGEPGVTIDARPELLHDGDG